MAAVVALIGALAFAAMAPAATPEATWTRCAAESEDDLLCGLPRGVASSPRDGAVAIADQEHRRVVMFNAWGEFLRTFGGGVTFGGAEGTGKLSSGSTVIEAAITSRGAFLVGETIEGAGIEAGTKISSIASAPGTGSKLFLSQPASEGGEEVALSVTEGEGNVPTDEIQTVSVPAAASGSYTLKFKSTVPTVEATTTPIAVGAPASGAGSVQEALEGLANVDPGDVTVSGPATGGAGQSIYSVEFTGRFEDVDVEALTVAGQPSGGTVTVATTRPGASGPEVCSELLQCTTTGVDGGAGGQFGRVGSVQGVAFDSAGDLFVVDRPNHRMQKFDSEGHFLRTWGKNVNKTKVVQGGHSQAEQDLCVAGEECQAGEEGTAPGEFGAWTVLGSYVAVDTHKTPSASDDEVYIGDRERIQRCNDQGGGCVSLPDPGGLLTSKTVASLAVVPSGSGASDEGRLFVVRESTANFIELNQSSGAEICHGTTSAAPRAVATDPAGNAFVVEGASGDPVRKFGPACTEVSEEEASAPFFPTYPFTPGFSDATGIAIGEACWTSPHYDLYLSKSVTSASDPEMNAYGPVPEDETTCPRVPHPPKIEAQATLTVEAERAVLRATINPRQRADTAYFVQYATAACVPAAKSPGEEDWGASCVTQTAEAPLGAGAIDSGAQTEKVVLEGLGPGTEYRYRFAAKSGGGGPVFGVGGTLAEDGTAAAFTTSSARPAPETGCANQALRYGASAYLPDCRAYEMVTPVDKNGGDAQTGRGGLGDYDQAAPGGDRLSYTTEPAFAGQPSSTLINQYMATREAGGWATRGINLALGRQLSGSDPSVSYPAHLVNAFSEDLCDEWAADYNFTPFNPAGQEGFVNLYRQDLCGPEALEALTTAPPAAGAPAAYVDFTSVQGLSGDGREAFFTAAAKLTGDAAETDNKQIYVHSEEGLQVVSVLPDGTADPGLVGGYTEVGGGIYTGEVGGNLGHAVSTDGKRAYWTSHLIRGGSSGVGAGRLFLRENPAAPQSTEERGSARGSGDLVAGSDEVSNASAGSGAFAAGQTLAGEGIPFGTTIEEITGSTLVLSAPATATASGRALEAFSRCTEAAKACTVPVSTDFTDPKAVFWTALPDGTAALFSEGQMQESGAGTATLFRFDAVSGAREEIVGGLRGVLGASRDLSRVYLISTEVRSGAQENEAGQQALGGKPNLYLYEAGSFTFIGTLADGPDGDVTYGEKNAAYDLGSANPLYNAAHVSADGSHLAFESQAQLTRYDNTDAVSGKPDVEVFRYTAGGALHCVSCDPSGARPRGGEMAKAGQGASAILSGVWGAGWIPGAGHALHAANALSEDGGRIFLNSFAPLVAGDVNGVQDVYEWEAPGVGSCTTAKPAYHGLNGGCLYLISSGESPFESLFVDASRDGSDVFFTTASSLLPQDPGLIDIYDARVGGGFAQPSELAACEGEACQGPAGAPESPTPASAAFQGPGNEKAGGPALRCPSGRRKVRRGDKVRCVAKHQHRRKHHRANDGRRQAR
jgi:hypothetical protein